MILRRIRFGYILVLAACFVASILWARSESAARRSPGATAEGLNAIDEAGKDDDRRRFECGLGLAQEEAPCPDEDPEDHRLVPLPN